MEQDFLRILAESYGSPIYDSGEHSRSLHGTYETLQGDLTRPNKTPHGDLATTNVEQPQNKRKLISFENYKNRKILETNQSAPKKSTITRYRGGRKAKLLTKIAEYRRILHITADNKERISLKNKIKEANKLKKLYERENKLKNKINAINNASMQLAIE